jgi:hypothetical protein
MDLGISAANRSMVVVCVYSNAEGEALWW